MGGRGSCGICRVGKVVRVHLAGMDGGRIRQKCVRKGGGCSHAKLPYLSTDRLRSLSPPQAHPPSMHVKQQILSHIIISYQILHKTIFDIYSSIHKPPQKKAPCKTTLLFHFPSSRCYFHHGDKVDLAGKKVSRIHQTVGYPRKFRFVLFIRALRTGFTSTSM